MGKAIKVVLLGAAIYLFGIFGIIMFAIGWAVLNKGKAE